MPITNPVLAETKVTEPGSKPLGTVVPAGGAGRGTVVVVVVDVGAVEVVVTVVVVVRCGAFFLAVEQDAAPSARQSTSATTNNVREPVMSGLFTNQPISDRAERPEVRNIRGHSASGIDGPCDEALDVLRNGEVRADCERAG
jgi:hypothetical protein